MNGHSILMVDDDADFIYELSSALRDAGYRVFEASDREHAREFLTEHKPDVVLLDKRLPDGDGQDMIGSFRALAPETRFIIVTAYCDAESAVRGYKDGIDMYLTKPTSPDEVLTAVNTLISKKEDQKNEKEYIASVAHELLNPLSIIKESMEITSENMTGEGNGAARHMMDISLKEISRITKFTKDMLSAAMMKEGKFPFSPKMTGTRELMNQISQVIETEFSSKNLVFVTDFAAAPASAYIDEELIKHMIFNLISNAAKYTEPGKKIFLRAFAIDDILRIEVEDEGCGIPDQDIPKIYERYGTLSCDKSEGHGIGLSLVKKIVDLHGGDIEVFSTQGKGTKFSISLPTAPQKMG